MARSCACTRSNSLFQTASRCWDWSLVVVQGHHVGPAQAVSYSPPIPAVSCYVFWRHLNTTGSIAQKTPSAAIAVLGSAAYYKQAALVDRNGLRSTQHSLLEEILALLRWRALRRSAMRKHTEFEEELGRSERGEGLVRVEILRGGRAWKRWTRTDTGRA